MKLTPIQINIVEHRLEVPDCLVDVLCDFEDDELPLGEVTPQEVEDAVTELYEIITGPFELAALTKAQRLVFEDCIESSTVPDLAQDAVGYPADAGGMSQQKANAFAKAHERLTDMIGGA